MAIGVVSRAVEGMDASVGHECWVRWFERVEGREGERRWRKMELACCDAAQEEWWSRWRWSSTRWINRSNVRKGEGRDMRSCRWWWSLSDVGANFSHPLFLFSSLASCISSIAFITLESSQVLYTSSHSTDILQIGVKNARLLRWREAGRSTSTRDRTHFIGESTVIIACIRRTSPQHRSSKW